MGVLARVWANRPGVGNDDANSAEANGLKVDDNETSNAKTSRVPNGGGLVGEVSVKGRDF